MKLLADENVDRAIVRWLREAGHDVFWAAEGVVAAADPDLMSIARRESRILLTGDLDFGEVVFRQAMVPAGVVLMRFRAASQDQRLRLLQAHWPLVESRVQGHFLVLRNRQARIRPMAPLPPRR